MVAITAAAAAAAIVVVVLSFTWTEEIMREMV